MRICQPPENSDGLALHVRGLEAQAEEHLLDLRADRPALAVLEVVLQLAHLVDQVEDLGGVALAGGDERVDLAGDLLGPRVHREQVVEGGGGLVGERLAGVRDAVLRQVAGGVRARADDLAGVGVDEAEDDLQQRGLARAVGADDRDALVVADAQREVAEEVLPAVLLLEVADGDQVSGLLCVSRWLGCGIVPACAPASRPRPPRTPRAARRHA